MKYQILRAIRAAGLLEPVDRCTVLVERVRTRARNNAFARAFPGFATPPADLAFDALNHVDWHAYRESGLAHAGFFARAIRGELGQGPLDVMEWGCGPGRIIRHIPALLGPRSLVGTDCNGRSVAWCRQNLAGIAFAANALVPPLQFADGSFDAVYGFSVLTHLAEATQLAWACELARVLRRGGLLVCTTHGDNYRHLLASAAERERFAAGEVVVQGGYAEGRKWFFAIHPEAFVVQRLLAGFSAVRRYPTTAAEAILQDVWVARKP